MRELRAHMSPEEYPPFVRDVATFLHATGMRRGLPSFVQAADALCESYGGNGRQRTLLVTGADRRAAAAGQHEQQYHRSQTACSVN
jgi:hypothetical protein